MISAEVSNLMSGPHFPGPEGYACPHLDAILGHEPQDMDKHYLYPDLEMDLRAAKDRYHTYLTGQIEAEQEKLQAKDSAR